MYKTLNDLPKPFIIADIGSNWCRYSTKDENLTCALRQIVSAASAGVNAVKFQMFTEEELYGFRAENNKYELPREWLPALASRAAECNVEFMCTAFSQDGYKYVDQFVNIHKVASAEITDLMLVNSVLKLGKPTLISTAAASWMDLTNILSMAIDKEDAHSRFGFMECVGAYPAKETEHRFDWGDSIMARFMVGLSDHTQSHKLALVGVGKGLRVFEVHYDCFANTAEGERLLSTPDAPFAFDAAKLYEYCRAIAWANTVMGSSKAVGHGDSESRFITQHRRRFVATENIDKGDTIHFGCYRLKHPVYMSGRQITSDEIYGKRAARNILRGEPIVHDDIE